MGINIDGFVIINIMHHLSSEGHHPCGSDRRRANTIPIESASFVPSLFYQNCKILLFLKLSTGKMKGCEGLKLVF